MLTVAVSIAAGVAALTSIFPELFDLRVAIGVGFVVLLWLGNLRGIRESASSSPSRPTSIWSRSTACSASGSGRLATRHPARLHTAAGVARGQGVGQALGLLLILRAFAAGSVALTGTEAVSNGVPAFRPPEARNAGIVLILMGVFFGSIFLGISFLAAQLGVVPDPTEQETVISQITRTLVGAGTPFHYLVQFSTALLLVLAANTAFADFPRLASILGKDRFLPRQFQFRGDRLAFSIGIMVLAILAGVLIVAFQGSVTEPDPALHGRRLRRLHPQPVRDGAATGGGCATRSVAGAGARRSTGRARSRPALVALVVGVAKFALGRLDDRSLLIPLLVGMMWAIHHHYHSVEAALDVDWTDRPLPTRTPRVIVPISRLDRPAFDAIAYARSISDDVRAVHVVDDRDGGRGDAAPLGSSGADPVKLVILESPYRALIGAAARVHRRDRRAGSEPARRPSCSAEFVPRHLWEYPLHNQTALRLKFRLFFRPNTVVIDVPYHLGSVPAA